MKHHIVRKTSWRTSKFAGNDYAKLLQLWIGKANISLQPFSLWPESPPPPPPLQFGINIREVPSFQSVESRLGKTGESQWANRGIKVWWQFRSDWCTVPPTHTCCSGCDGSFVEVVGLETRSDNKIKQWTASYLAISFVYVECKSNPTTQITRRIMSTA